MVERAAAGEALSSPQPPEAGARRARLYGVSSVTENRNRETMPSSWCDAGFPMGRPDPVQPTLGYPCIFGSCLNADCVKYRLASEHRIRKVPSFISHVGPYTFTRDRLASSRS